MNSLGLSGIIIIMVALFTSGIAEGVTLDKYLKLVHDNHPFFKKEGLSKEIERERQASFLGLRDWGISASPNLSYQRKSQDKGLTAQHDIKNLNVDISAEKLMWNTGGRVSFSYSSTTLNRSTSNLTIPVTNLPGTSLIGLATIPGNPSTYYSNGLSATYSHPLLQNKGGLLDRLAYDLASYDVKIAELTSQENKESFLVAAGIRFLDWVLITEQIEITKERLSIAEKQLERIEKKRRANLVDKVDVLRAEDTARIVRQNLMLLNTKLKAKTAEIATIAGSGEIIKEGPDFDLYMIEKIPTIEESLEQMKGSSRILKRITFIHDQLRHRKRSLDNQEKAQLNLFLGAGLKDSDGGFGSSFGTDKPEMRVGFIFRYPLGNNTVKSDIAANNLQIRQVERNLQSVEVDLTSTLKAQMIQIKEFEKVLALNREQIKSAKLRRDEEEKLFNLGRGDLNFVIQSLDNIENAKLIYAGNMATYHNIILQYHGLLDEVLPHEQTINN